MNETLKDLRESAKKTCAEVAQALGVSNRAVYHYENGDRQISIEQVIILSKLYGVTAEEVIQAQLNSCNANQIHKAILRTIRSSD